MIYGSDEAPNAKCTLKVTPSMMVCAGACIECCRPQDRPDRPAERGYARLCSHSTLCQHDSSALTMSRFTVKSRHIRLQLFRHCCLGFAVPYHVQKPEDTGPMCEAFCPSALLLQDKDKPILFTMARLDRVKNLTGLVEWFGRNGRLRGLVNLVVVGGIVDPSQTSDRRVGPNAAVSAVNFILPCSGGPGAVLLGILSKEPVRV